MIDRMSKLDESNISKFQIEQLNGNYLYNSNFSGFLDEIVIDLKEACETEPHPAMVEECELPK